MCNPVGAISVGWMFGCACGAAICHQTALFWFGEEKYINSFEVGKHKQIRIKWISLGESDNNDKVNEVDFVLLSQSE